ncbi:sensor histidine kinase [Mesobaculum littorinae]|uniref:sensor histidine kinase n=1 Tax=Mesobaculum littorinae TaxID=2486419 RepID=UPI0038B2F11B
MKAMPCPAACPSGCAVQPTWAMSMSTKRGSDRCCATFCRTRSSSRTGGGRVEVAVTQERGRVVVSVIDAGVGIPQDKFDRIFQRFSQVDGSSARNSNGTGLGLAISKELTERMGGRIGFTSSYGAGSTFWVSFPVVRQPAPRAAQDGPLLAYSQPPAARHTGQVIEDRAG